MQRLSLLIAVLGSVSAFADGNPFQGMEFTVTQETEFSKIEKNSPDCKLLEDYLSSGCDVCAVIPNTRGWEVKLKKDVLIKLSAVASGKENRMKAVASVPAVSTFYSTDHSTVKTDINVNVTFSCWGPKSKNRDGLRKLLSGVFDTPKVGGGSAAGAGVSGSAGSLKNP